MDGLSYVRWWSGVNDCIHPLARGAHVAVAHGRYVYVFNGCTPDGTRFCLFDRAGVARLDTVTNSVHFLPVHWDSDSIRRRGFTQPILTTSGAAAAIENTSVIPTLSQSTSPKIPAKIYIFGGFSLLGNIYLNALICIRLPAPASLGDSLLQTCCHAEVLSGHGVCAELLCQSRSNNGLREFTLVTLLHFLQQEMTRSPHRFRCRETIDQRLPSPRDKLTIECWNERLYVFGGYGPSFCPPDNWSLDVIQWPFLYSRGTDLWIPCENDNGWNNQLLVYDLKRNTWSLVGAMTGNMPTPRAAHKSALHSRRGWMFIFGGRGPPASPVPLINADRSVGQRAPRLNDLYCLDLYTLQWTRVHTPMDDGQSAVCYQPVWPDGRSWMAISLLPDCYSPGGDPPLLTRCRPGSNIHLFLAGGFSNSAHSLSDAYVIQVKQSNDSRRLVARVVVVLSPGTGNVPTAAEMCTRSQQAPHVIDGFHCEFPPPHEPDASISVDLNSGACRLLERLVVHATNSLETDILCRTIAILQQATLAPSNLQKGGRPPGHREPFFHVARLFTDLIVYLLTHFSLVVPCPPDERAVQHREGDDVVAHAYRSAVGALTEPEHSVLVVLLDHLLRFLPAWDPVLMVLREDDAWLPVNEQTCLLRRMATEHLLAVDHSVASLDLSSCQQSVIDKLTLLFPLDKVRLPQPYREGDLVNNLRQDNLYQLQHLTRHFVLAVLLLRCNNSPVSLSSDRLSASLARPPDSEGAVLQQPCPRYWHSVCLTLDGRLCVIGGFPEEVKLAPVTYYEVGAPPSLSVCCYRNLAGFSLRARRKRLFGLQEEEKQQSRVQCSSRMRWCRLRSIASDRKPAAAVTCALPVADSDSAHYHVVRLDGPVNHHLPIPFGHQIDQVISCQVEQRLAQWVLI